MMQQQVDLVPLDGAPDLVRVERGASTTVSPANSAHQRGHLGGAVDQRRRAEPDQARAGLAAPGLLPLVGQRHAGDEVDAAAERAPDVLAGATSRPWDSRWSRRCR